MLASASRTQLSLSSRVAVNASGVRKCGVTTRSVTTMASFHDFTAKVRRGEGNTTQRATRCKTSGHGPAA